MNHVTTEMGGVAASAGGNDGQDAARQGKEPFIKREGQCGGKADQKRQPALESGHLHVDSWGGDSSIPPVRPQ